MSLYFITGNKGKLAEAQAVIPELEQLDIDLPEIQALDATVIIQAKLEEAFKHHTGPFIVEDTSLYLDCLNGLPGPLIKWFLETIKSEGIYELVEKYGNNKAQAKTIIGYAKNKDNIQYFEGVLEGEIVRPAGTNDFGWGPIFKPNGRNRTFAEMESAEKYEVSMRRLALNKLKAVL